MTPATEALAERLREAAQVQRWANNDPMVCLLGEAEVEIRRLSRNPTIRDFRIVAEPPAQPRLNVVAELQALALAIRLVGLDNLDKVTFHQSAEPEGPA